MARVPDKRQTMLHFLERGVAMVHLDARKGGVIVPPQYAEEPHLRLNLSYRYNIPDLEMSDRNIQATLSFGGRPFQCLLPWTSIFGITSHAGEGQVWPEDLPGEVMEGIATKRDPRAPSGVKGRPALSCVPDIGEEEEAPSPEQDEVAKTERPRPHLRHVR
jgi:stringent starvation protein B